MYEVEGVRIWPIQKNRRGTLGSGAEPGRQTKFGALGLAERKSK